MDLLIKWLELTSDMITRSALLLLVGFFIAGIIRALITPNAMKSLFGRKPLAQIFRSSVIGIPLPLCSCSVLPVADQLRRSGLSRPGTVSFLISTPETGVDSIALSYRLLGPYFAMIRPIAALITALISGLISWLFNRDEDKSPILEMPIADDNKPGKLIERLINGQKYIVKSVYPELAYYLFWGFLLAGLAAAIIPSDLVKDNVSAWIQYIAVITVSLPVYVCATSSTPMAVVLLSMGVTPGAVLVFLLIGPATNMTSLVVQKRILGYKGMILMTVSIIVTSVILGILIDLFNKELFASHYFMPDSGVEGELVGWYDLIAGLFLAITMIFYTGRYYFRKVMSKVNKGK
ncbi:MAG: permease [candidate division Zixibacteria bacterium]